MGMREDALRRILSLDARRSAEFSLRSAQGRARARHAAVLAVEGERYVIFVATELDQEDLDRIGAAWMRERAGLQAGRPVITTSWALIPVGHRAAGALYLGGTGRSLTTDVTTEISR